MDVLSPLRTEGRSPGTGGTLLPPPGPPCGPPALRRGRWAVQRLSLALTFLGLALAAAVPEAKTEAEVKADYLVVFSKYVDWPAGTFATTTQPLVIGVIGDRAIAEALDQRAAGRVTQGGRTVTTRLARRAADLTGCQVVFIGQSERPRLREITQTLAGKAVLTVCDTDGIFEQDVMIKFVRSEERMRFEVKLEPTQRVELRLHAGMLVSAKRVWHPPSPQP